jgi:hypothetical protein
MLLQSHCAPCSRVHSLVPCGGSRAHLLGSELWDTRRLRSLPELRGGGPKLPGTWQYLSPLTWGAGIQSCGTSGGVWMLALLLVLTWSLYAGVPGLQGIDSGP